MQLIQSNRKEIAIATTDARCVAIANRYGDFSEFCKVWSPMQLSYILENVESSVERKVPTLVMMMLTYGTENIRLNLRMMLRGIVKIMGENNIKEDDIKTIARLITETPSLRLLNYAYLTAFFKRVEQGEFPLYACKPHQFMNALQTYAKTALASQRILQAEAEAKEEHRRYEEHRKSAITFEEFKRRTGYQGNNPLSKEA